MGLWHKKRSAIIIPYPNRCFISLLLLPFKKQSLVNNLRSKRFRTKSFHALGILTARKIAEARANISTKMSRGRAGEHIFALVPVCAWLIWYREKEPELCLSGRLSSNITRKLTRAESDRCYFQTFFSKHSIMYITLYTNSEHTIKRVVILLM